LRRGYRASIGQKHVIFRLPHGHLPQQQQTYIDKLTDWARATYQKKPAAFLHLLPLEIPDKGSIVIMDELHDVAIIRNQNRQSHFAAYDDSARRHIKIELSSLLPPVQKKAAVQTLISRLSAKKYLSEVSLRVDELNEKFFQCPIGMVRLKLTQTRWGSCSHKGNINLSSRLLLAPSKVRDAVIIHELAHRLEMNHGKKFWQHVYDAMPDYDVHQNYLTKYGKNLNFVPRADYTPQK